MWAWIVSVAKWIFSSQGAAIAIEGFDRFSARMEKRLVATEGRLDDCERDRDEMRSNIGTLQGRVEECDEDRADLRSEISGLKDKVETLEEKSNG